ncbi:hypothetical protein [Desulfatiferula olefinivorans]
MADGADDAVRRKDKGEVCLLKGENPLGAKTQTEGQVGPGHIHAAGVTFGLFECKGIGAERKSQDVHHGLGDGKPQVVARGQRQGDRPSGHDHGAADGGVRGIDRKGNGSGQIQIAVGQRSRSRHGSGQTRTGQKKQPL